MTSASRVATRYVLATTPVTDIDAKFKAAFAQVKENPMLLHEWLVKAWEWYNKKYTGGVLKKIFIRMQRNTVRAKSLGQYGKTWISIHPRAFMVGADLVLHILKHEMCHQAVWEIDHTRESEGSNHGPTFNKWATKFGVKEGRYIDMDGDDHESLKTDDEKYEIERKKKIKEKAVVAEKPFEMWSAREGSQAKFFHDNYWIPGVLVRPISKDRWWFVTGYNSLWKVQTTSFFEMKPEERIPEAEAKGMLDRSLSRLGSSDARRQQTKDTRNLYRGLRNLYGSAPGFMDPKTKRVLNEALRAAGFDGHGRFEKPSQGYAKAVQTLAKFNIELGEIVNSWAFREENNHILIRMAFSNEADILSPVEIKNSRLSLSWSILSPGRYEVIAYMS